MRKASYHILPNTERILADMGEQIKNARLQKNVTVELLAERSGVSRTSIWKVERGDPSVAMGIYAAVLHGLNNMDRDLLLIAKDEPMIEKWKELNLNTRKRASRRER